MIYWILLYIQNNWCLIVLKLKGLSFPGLPRHKTVDDWGSMPSIRKSKYPPCDCCPYGYHIDLDFVRYCETLAQGVTGDAASKQRRKERRRQRKSMEVLLGLNSPPTWSSDLDVPQVCAIDVVMIFFHLI